MTSPENTSDTILELRGVKKYFPLQRGLLDAFTGREQQYLKAIDGVTLSIQRGEVFGLAGESGSGKSTLGRLAVKLHDPSEGEVIFNGTPLNGLGHQQLVPLRSQMQTIFQDPVASMNPRMSLLEGIGHGLKIHKMVKDQAEFEAVVGEMMNHVGLNPAENYFHRYPHQLSGGQRQRAVIARALVLKPQFIMADEPIAMADVSVRAVLLELMKRLQKEFNLTYLFITHDLSTAKYICDRIGIMYLGKVVEMGNLRSIYSKPAHPYTEALLAAVPTPDPKRRNQHIPLPKGEIPNPINPPSGCSFHPRCPIAQEVCKREVPQLRPMPDAPGHLVACHLRSGDYVHLDTAGRGGQAAAPVLRG
jgi:peptide/nickel transport system ATP-binding protein